MKLGPTIEIIMNTKGILYRVKFKIPQNKKEKFIFIINKKKNFIDIQFNHLTKINTINLFLILQWYLSRSEFIAKNIYINSSDINSDDFDINIFHHITIEKFKKMKYFDFKEWFSELKNNDYEYIKNLKYYGFRIVFYQNSIVFDETNNLPEYPWNSNYKKIWIKKENNISLIKWLSYKNKKLYLYYIKYKNKRHTI